MRPKSKARIVPPVQSLPVSLHKFHQDVCIYLIPLFNFNPPNCKGKNIRVLRSQKNGKSEHKIKG